MMQKNEAERLQALRQLKLLDTPPSESFDRITRMASRLLSAPIAAVSLTDEDRQWFKSRVGVQHWSIPRERAPCAQVAESAGVVVIPDLLEDPCYRNSVLAQSGVRFYAGAPLVTDQGHGLGAMCVLDSAPRAFSAEDEALLSDLAAMVMAQIELQHAMGRIDPVSGLPNRRQLDEDLQDLAREAPGAERRYLLLVDIATNEQLDEVVRVAGPAYLDAMVLEAAEKIAQALGPGRQAYQVGATQMAFLSDPAVGDEAAYLALVRRMLAYFRSDADSRFVTTTAIGLTQFETRRASASDLLRQAHNAAKDARALDAPVALYSAELDAQHHRRFALVNALGETLGAGGDQLRLVYQPRVCLRSGACLGAEALLRWTHPTLGELSPGEFIPIVERTRLARETTAWVLDAALRQQADWRRRGITLRLSVNLSAANLEEQDFPERLAAALARHGVPASALELEVTESAMMDDPARSMAVLAAIAELGVELAIDDFGTGHSSLAYLQRLPAQVIKIDQSFVRDVELVGRNGTLVQTMIGLAKAFDFRVVAEGVETEQARARLTAAGCDEAQGYLFAKPLAPEAFERWLAESARRPRDGRLTRAA